MTTQLFVLLLIGTVLVVYSAIAIATWFRVRGTRIVTCPETHRPAAVTVDVGHAAVTAVWDKAEVTLGSCSRWPARAGCDQACAAQIAAAPGETRARTIATHFFEGARCAICHQRVEAIHTATLQPGLLDPITRDVKAWTDVAPEALPDAFQTWLPLCPSCTLAESFRLRFPDLVLERTPRPGSVIRP